MEKDIKEQQKKNSKIQQALLKLSRLDYESFEETLKVISETTAMTLDVERVSIWLYDSEQSALICQDLFEISKNIHSKGITIYEYMYPVYFKTVMTEQIIAVRDVYTEYKLSEFIENYLKPFGIISLMDVPVRTQGHRCGVMCCEHTGQQRDWLQEEQDFSISISNLISLAIETYERKKSEELLKLREKALEKIRKELENRVIERTGELEKANEMLKFENLMRQKTEKELHYRLSAEEIISSISGRFINITSEEIDRELETSLKIIGEFLSIDRCFINYFSSDGKIIDEVYEWFAQGTTSTSSSYKKHYKNQKLENFPLYTEKFRNLEVINISSMDEWPAGKEEKEILLAQGIKSFRFIPMCIGHNLIGNFGLISEKEEKKWKESDVMLLKMVGEIFANILERKRTEEKIKRSEQRLSFHVKNTPLAYIEFDRELHILAWNPSAETIFGYRADEVIGCHGDIIIPFSIKEQAIPGQNVISQTAGKTNTVETITKDGRKIICNWYNTTLIDEKGDVIGLASLVQDITEQKELEKELMKAKDGAEQANIAKSQFLATMSHEIRTPLNAIIGMTSLLMETSITEEQKEFIETIRISSDNLLKIISDILDFSKIEAERFELEYQPFNLRTCIEEALNLVFPGKCNDNIDIVYIFHNDNPQGIRGDMTKVMQILVNLLSNAVKFTEKGDIILTVSSKHISEQDYEILFAVKDSGIGIERDKISLLFRPFSQIDNSTKRKYEGTGLGLAISKNFCEMMGGNIWVESEVNKGTTFYFTIMAHATHDIPWDFPYGSQEKLSGKKILIVSRKELTANLIKSYCNDWGMDVIAVDSADEAIQSNGKKFDCVLIDVPLTDMDNIKAVSNIHKYLSPGKVPLIMFSSMRDQLKTVSPEITSYLTKPFKPFELYSVLNNFFSDYRNTKYTYPVESDDMNGDNFLRILLAEDRVINQKVALRLLEHCGYMADIASNGIEVLEALKRQIYDVILMDVQMPDMNGLEATRVIRKEIPEDRQPWIIAMTAGAFTHDREECFMAGMNDYISKPIKLDKLKESLSKCKRIKIYEPFLPASMSGIEDKEIKLSFNHKDIFDRQALLENLEGDEELFRELIDIFLATIPSDIESLKQALSKKDSVQARRYAHSIKGVSGNIKAKTLSSIALNIEMAAKEGDIEKALSLVPDIEEGFLIFKRLIL